MPKTLRYDVIVEMSIKDFVDCVNSFAGDGWKLEGGMTVVVNDEGFPVFYQAISKEVK